MEWNEFSVGQTPNTMNRLLYGEGAEGAERHIGYYLCDDFSLLPFVSAIEPLRIANRLSRRPLYQWSIVTNDGGEVRSTSGLALQSRYSLQQAPEFDTIFVCGPHEPKCFSNPEVLFWLADQSNRDIVMGGIETGSLILAKAGLLNNVRCTTHWENVSEFRESFPHLVISTDLFEVDTKRLTCSGGAASMDMMLFVIEQHHGHELAASVADVMIHPYIRHASEPQRMNIKERIGVSHPVLLECVELMEANIEEPLCPSELAKLVGISKRQLERLFRRYLNSTPARYYLTLRLEMARSLLLEHRAMKIIDVAMACGFKSAGHFSSRYCSSFGVTPRHSRKFFESVPVIDRRREI